MSLTFIPTVAKPTVSPIVSGTNNVGSSVGFAWQNMQEIDLFLPVSWDIIAYGISTSVAFTFNQYAQVATSIAPITYGLVRPIDFAINDHLFIPGIHWDNLKGLSKQSRFTWNVSAITHVNKSFKWNILVGTSAVKAFTFNVLHRVQKPGTVLAKWTNQILEPLVHPISAPNASLQSYFTWNISKSLSITRAMRFNTTFRKTVNKAFAFNVEDLHVTKQLAVSWNTLGPVTPRRAFSWVLPSRRTLNKKFTWQLTSSVNKAGAMHWNLHNQVTQTRASTWKLSKQIPVTRMMRFNTRKAAFTDARFLFKILTHERAILRQLVSNSPGNIVSSVVRPIDISGSPVKPVVIRGLTEPIVQPVDYAYYSSQGYTEAPGSTFRVGINPNGPVSAVIASRYNVLSKVTAVSPSIQWGSETRSVVNQQFLFDTRFPVSENIAVQWNIGRAAELHIRQTVQERIDFAY